MDAREFGDSVHFLGGGLEVAILQIVEYCVVEQNCVLRAKQINKQMRKQFVYACDVTTGFIYIPGWLLGIFNILLQKFEK